MTEIVPAWRDSSERLIRSPLSIRALFIYEETVNPMAMARCPDCEAEIEVAEDAMIGEILSCPDCGLELEIEKVDQEAVELQKLAIEKEDWGE